MKIDRQQMKLPVQDKSVQRGKEALAHKKGALKAQTPIENSKVSDFALHKLKDTISATPDINLDRVNALKEKIQKGEYQVDTNKLAKNLIKNSIIEDV